MVRQLLAVTLCGLAFAGGRPAAQSASPSPSSSTDAPQGTTTFRAGIDAVTVDASVTDKQGHPVTDLTASDFEIFENKKPQVIQNFKLIQVNNVPATDLVTTGDITSMDEMQQETARDDVRLLVIFLDDYHVRLGNAMAFRLKLANFVRQLTTHDLVAVMYPLTPVAALTFSRDHEATADAIMGFKGRKYDYTAINAYEEQYAVYPPETQEVIRRQVTVSALEGVAKYLGTLREGKKLVLFVSEGLVGSLPPGVLTTGSMSPSAQLPLSQAGQDRQAFNDKIDVLDEMQRVFAAAARSNTSFYTIDPRGLATSEFDVSDNVGSENDRRTLSEAVDSLRELAENTDGRAFVGSNDPMPQLKRMLADTSAYYLLGYTSTEAPRDGKFHEIQVRVKRKDVQVRARKGYWALSSDEFTKASAPTKAGPSAAVEDALAKIEKPSDHAVHVWAGADRGDDGKSRVTVAWETTADPALQGGRGASTLDVVDHITLTATSIAGDPLFKGPVPRDTLAAERGGRVTFDAPPGSVRLDIVAENATGLRVDHEADTVDVPDFTAVGPMITTPLVYRGETAYDIKQIRAAASPRPAVARAFSRTEQILVRFQALGPGGVPPTVTLRLLNSLGTAVTDLPDPTRLSDGTLELALALAPLAPADYVIEITAKTADGAQAQKLLAIRVTS